MPGSPKVNSVEHALEVFKALSPSSQKQMRELIREDAPSVLMGDAELCSLLSISLPTLRSYITNGPPESATRDGNALDVRMIQRADIGTRRRWVRSSVMSLIHGE